ncbi:carbohydrate ABC transporter permease [Scopulibacillus darangshiensis]|uniref:carbohydrate ABC transporter permease n=1 Tax=Scopulibacillus darangshiensis TaxID=442528 RepID=UPI001FB352A6|nr:sugar ABC transporter permease [Scopulibacillus darangshiensis]
MAKNTRLPFQKTWTQKASTQKRIFLLLAVTPPFLGYLLFSLYPNILSVYYALLNWNGISEPVFVGFDNFVKMLHDQFVWRALYHNFLLLVAVVPLTIIISLFLAYLITYMPFRENAFLKVLFFFPNVLSTVVIALLWAFIYDGNYGLLNSLLRMFGINLDTFWLGQESTALWALVLPFVWGGVGLYVIIFSNAMLSIPKSLYESAILDGAGHMTLLFKITIPLLRPIIYVGVLFVSLGTIKGFETVLILTNGGPAGSTDVLGLYMFNLAFGETVHNYGYASAVGMLLFIILTGTKLIMDKFFPNSGVEY